MMKLLREAFFLKIITRKATHAEKHKQANFLKKINIHVKVNKFHSMSYNQLVLCISFYGGLISLAL